MKKAIKDTLFGLTTLATAAFAACASADMPDESNPEHIITQACNADAPFLVLDFFSLQTPDYGSRVLDHYLDIDGDQINDMHHGDLIAKIVELNGKEVIRYNYNLAEGETPADFTQQTANATFNELAEAIRSGKIERPAAILISTSHSLSIPGLDYTLGGELGLSSANIGGKKDAIIAQLTEQHEANPDSSQSLYETMIAISTIVNELNIPVITASGNDYSGTVVNTLALFGATPIGALTHDGLARTPYTNDNSLTAIYRVGDIIARTVDNGIDINGDGIADFSTTVLSAEPSIASLFNGQEVPAPTPAPSREDGFYAHVALNNYLFGAATEDDLIANEQRYMKEARLYGEYTHIPSHTQFRDDGTGRLIFDPAGNGDTSQVALKTGSSFAVPNICN